MLTFRTIADLFEDYEAAPTDHASDTGYWHFHDVTLKVDMGPFAAGDKLGQVFIWMSPFDGCGITLCRTREDFDASRGATLRLALQQRPDEK